MERGKPPPEIERRAVEGFAAAFIPRSDCYPLQLATGRYIQKKEPLTLDRVYQHLMGTLTLGAYALNSASQARWLCFDADDDGRFAQLKALAYRLQAAQQAAFLELSRRGGHLWLFVPPMSGAETRRLARQMRGEYDLDPTIEIYPKQDQLLTGAGSLVRLPLGVHRKTGRRYHFITPDGQPLAPTIREQLALLAQPPTLSEAFIARTLAAAPPHKPLAPTLPFEPRPTLPGAKLSDALKHTLSVYEFVSRFVDLDARGVGLCPFHDDHEVSFQVNIEANYWNCYAGCGGGSLIDFWMKWRELTGSDGSFTATIKDLRSMLLTLPAPPKKKRKK